MFLLKKLISVFLLPPAAFLVLVATGLVLWQRRPRLGAALAWMGLACGVLFSSAWFVDLLLLPLEDIPVLSAEAARGAQAVVILGGGRSSNAPEYGGESVNRVTLERVRYGARVARLTGLPVLVSGGAPAGGTTEAALMKAALEQDFRIPARWAEETSLDTRGNARNTAALLRPLGIRRVVLVSHAAHLRRALAEFRAAGLEPVPAPTAFLGRRANADSAGGPGDFLPTPSAAFAGWYAAHEWLGLLAQRLSGIP